MNVVADTNIFLAVALNEPKKEWIVGVTSGYDAISPQILPYEIGNALTAMVKRGRILKEDVLLIYEITQEIPVNLIAVDIKSALEIATQFNIYAYDAYFLQSALSMNCPLMTLDNKMKEVATSLNIKILE